MIYFDSAATSLQKPSEVAEAVYQAMHTLSSPGRGGYPSATKAAEVVFDCRCELQEMFGASSPEQVVFTSNATHALNIAIKSLVPRGGRAVVSGYEHNAVTRPLNALDAEMVVASGPLFAPNEMLAAFESCITEDTDAVICTHVSNVFGCVQPVEAIGALCRRINVPFIIDASQSAGLLPLDIQRSGAAFIAMPGHKGLYGPQGTGVLICAEDVPVRTLLEGGTGSRSAEAGMPDFLPDRLEAGTHNVPGIAGLLEGLRFVRKTGETRICKNERILAAIAAEGLMQFPETEVFASKDLFAQTGVLSFRRKGIPAEILGSRLTEKGICVRAGLHCAPLAHRTAGTLETGTVRISFSAWNTPEEVFRFLDIAEAELHAGIHAQK